MYETTLHLTRLFLEENNNIKRLPIVTFHLLHNYVMTEYDLHDTALSNPVYTFRGRAKYGTTELKPSPFAVSYQIEPIILRYIQTKQECGQPMTQFDVIYCDKSLITVSTIVTAINHFRQSNSQTQQDNLV